MLVFFDDILIYSPAWTTHLEHLAIVLDCLRQHQLFTKLSKCSFGQHKLEYLGHIVSDQGVEMDPSKVQVVQDWPCPTTVTQLKAFLGLTRYYRRFINHYASIAGPLIDLLHKDNFRWTSEADVAFRALQQALTTTSVLSLSDFTQPFIVETDASGQGIGVVLSQNGHPIAFFSKKLSSRMQK